MVRREKQRGVLLRGSGLRGGGAVLRRLVTICAVALFVGLGATGCSENQEGVFGTDEFVKLPGSVPFTVD